MAISDCAKCWSTPCECGWEYRNYLPETMVNQVSKILQYRSKEEALKMLEMAKVNIQNNENWIGVIEGDTTKK